MIDERLAQVAVVYQAAVAEGKPPVWTVARTMLCARSTAGRLVQQARARGLLPETTPGKVAAWPPTRGHDGG